MKSINFTQEIATAKIQNVNISQIKDNKIGFVVLLLKMVYTRRNRTNFGNIYKYQLHVSNNERS